MIQVVLGEEESTLQSQEQMALLECAISIESVGGRRPIAAEDSAA
jgi:hypothetical protein